MMLAKVSIPHHWLLQKLIQALAKAVAEKEEDRWLDNGKIEIQLEKECMG